MLAVQHMLAESAAAGDPLTEFALQGRLDLMRKEVAGENPSPLEVLLAERIAAAWMFHQLLAVFCAGQLWTGASKEARASISTTRFYLDWQDRAHRQLLNAIKTLAQLRRLQSGMPNSQTNVQINVSRGDARSP